MMPEGAIAGAVVMGATAALIPLIGRVVHCKPGDILIAMVAAPAAWLCCLLAGVEAGVHAYRAERERIRMEMKGGNRK